MQLTKPIEKRCQKVISRGEIYMCNLPIESGSIQANYRPVLLLQNDVGNHFSTTTIVAPISRKGKKLPTQVKLEKGVGGIAVPSYILCEQIRTIDQSWLDKYIGKIHIDSQEFIAVQRSVMISLGFLSAL